MSTKVHEKRVSIYNCTASYPKSLLPPRLYTEFSEIGIHSSFDPDNHVFEGVRQSFIQLGLDQANINTLNWNPLGELVEKGNTVLLKPNLVKHRHKQKNSSLLELITHPSVIKAVMDYVFLALQGQGTIIIGDSPIQEGDFEKIKDFLQVEELINGYSKFGSVKVEFTDFRLERANTERYREIERFSLAGDPRGYTTIDLGSESLLNEYSSQYDAFRVTNYDKDKMFGFHSSKNHKYIISNSVLDADVVISLPKLKTHRKVGITCALKNLVGINGSKYCLPHHRKGSLEEGGDEYRFRSRRKKMLSDIDEVIGRSNSALLCRFLYGLKLLLYMSVKIKKFKDPFREGNWYMNDTIPRTAVDLNTILLFSSKKGVIRYPVAQRKVLVVTDAIIAGEKDGPLNPTRKKVGLLISSKDPILNDITACYLMGFDHQKVLIIVHALNSKINVRKITDLDTINVKSNLKNCNSIHDIMNYHHYNFVPPDGWRGHIEFESELDIKI